MSTRKRARILILILLLAAAVSACGSPSGDLVGTWAHYATVIDGVSQEALGMFNTFNADGTGRIWHPELEGDNTFEWEAVNGELFIETAVPPGWLQEENPIPDHILQNMLEDLSRTFLYEIDGDRLILRRAYILHQSIYEIYIRIGEA